MNLYIPWILRLPVSMGRKLEEVGERYSRNDFIPQESSWPITREENVRPTVNRGESRPEIGSHSYFSLSLSLHRATLCAALPLPSVRRNLVLHRNATSWTWLVFKEAGGIHQTGPPGFHPNLLASNLDRGYSVFFFWEKSLLEAVSEISLRQRWSKKGFKFVVFGKGKKIIILKLIANRWIGLLIRVIRSYPIEVSNFLLCLYARRVLLIVFYFFLFFFRVSSISKFTIGDEISGICLNFPRPCSKERGKRRIHTHTRWSSRFVDFVWNNDRTLADTASYI